MENQDALFIKGFNGGYLLAQYEPDLLAKVLKNLSLSNEYVSGLSHGQKEYQQERSRNELSNIASLRDQTKDRSQDVEQE